MKFVFADNTIHWMGASITMKPVDQYNMLAEAHDVGYQPEDALFVQYLNLILDQEDKILEDESMLLERNYVNVTPNEVVNKQEHLSNQHYHYTPSFSTGRLAECRITNSRLN